MAFKIVLLTCLLAFASADDSSPESPRRASPRVVGGRNAAKGEFPHQVSLQTSGQHFCGGAILSETWVLTAAHCILPGRSIVVKAGKHNVHVPESTEQSSNVIRTIKHELYKGEVQPYDIALLQLGTPLRLNQHVSAIRLPAPGSEPRGTAILSGWGSVSRTQQPRMPSVLQTASLPLMDASSCKQAFSRVNPMSGNAVHSTNVCTSAGPARLSACSGDSGGPLISASKEIIGVVSWGNIPCGSGSPSVYTKVSSFNDWIKRKMSSY